MPTKPWRRMLAFQGRARRTEFWLYALAYGLVVAGCIAVAIHSSGPVGGLAFLLTSTVFLAALVPVMAAQVRRFHDQERSGYFVLLNAVPYVGVFIVLIFMCLPGTKGPNAYGPDPRLRV